MSDSSTFSRRPVQSGHPLRFGIWAPYRGQWVVGENDHLVADFDFNREVIQSAERVGFDTVLIAQHTINPIDQAEEILEAWTAAAAAAALTERIEIIAAIKPRLYHPAVLAKMALGIEDISHGRFAINFVNAWFKPELERSGIGFPEHDERYAYGGEWLRIVRALIAGEEVTADGPNFRLDRFRLSPRSRYRDRPIIYAGGESEPGLQLVDELADHWLINGRPLEDVVPLVDNILSRRAPGRPPLGIGVTGFVLARETDAEAVAEVQRLLDIQEPFFAARREKMKGNIDEKAEALKVGFKYPDKPMIGANGGTLPGFVGSYDTVAKRLAEFHGIGISTFMLSFFPLIAEQERFAEHVIPRARALVASQALAKAS
ncbi:LLM class flavin-dependent oxidoreductase [Aquamicrobium sp. NLF2-7]|uniref:LLM class flavin-dependent oxidoreductase n=1 Tax=Aquamicrobium sp. NLF2-7 TaxID=2918753 RepID=UPI001EFAAB00|nr:LLM class flavin-dependent oxidoreductase [Aquamicrobium sp. NLF2-7]MCG8273744.1 LLM class flavin-dependent oxidoreductase [Aquamicrobium sp. NLF2-7]